MIFVSNWLAEKAGSFEGSVYLKDFYDNEKRRITEEGADFFKETATDFGIPRKKLAEVLGFPSPATLTQAITYNSSNYREKMGIISREKAKKALKNLNALKSNPTKMQKMFAESKLDKAGLKKTPAKKPPRSVLTATKTLINWVTSHS